jgi:hypothetical protein
MTNPGSVPSVNTLADTAKTGSELFIDGKAVAVSDGELLLEAILREKQNPACLLSLSADGANPELRYLPG